MSTELAHDGWLVDRSEVKGDGFGSPRGWTSCIQHGSRAPRFRTVMTASSYSELGDGMDCDQEGTFAFQVIGADAYAVVHAPTSLAWHFAVERPRPLFLRSLMPRRTPQTPPTTKATSAIRRAAFQFAVSEARRLGLID